MSSQIPSLLLAVAAIMLLLSLFSVGEAGERCLQPKRTGRCKGYMKRFYYDQTIQDCTTFVYGGCDGNDNNFETNAECQKTCVKKQEKSNTRGQGVCSFPSESGICYGYFPKYYYDKDSRECKEFTYGGCGGNGNRFDTKEECQSMCQH